jgi:hypothetical protein
MDITDYEVSPAWSRCLICLLKAAERFTLTSATDSFIDSSRRGVEATDNVVHAYDPNMQIPDTPLVSGAEYVLMLWGAKSFSVWDAAALRRLRRVQNIFSRLVNLILVHKQI